MGFSIGGTCLSGCFSRRKSSTSRPVFVQTPFRRRPPPPFLVDGLTDLLPQLSRQQGAVEDVRQAIFLQFYVSFDVALLSPALCQRIPHYACIYSLLPEVKLAVDPHRISLALWAPRVLVNTTWANTRGLSEFHFRSSTPRHSAASTAVNRPPTLPGGVE